MIAKNPKRTGGPKSPEGKAKVSKNAIKHGLSATSLTDERQVALVNQFIKELIQYYKPKSPLEKMYIERIAQTRAKLQKLSEIESVGVMLAQADLKHRPELVLSRFTHVSDSVKQIALKMLLGKTFKFPLKLTEDVLGSLCQEVAEMSGVLESEAELPVKLPQFSQFLKDAKPLGDDAKHKLSSDDPLFLDNQLRLCVAKIKLDRDNSVGPIVGEDRLAQLERTLLNLARQSSADAISAKPEKRTSSIRSYQVVFSEDFEIFRLLLLEYRAAFELVEHVRSISVQMQRVATLPDHEMDKMMRYQTTLERRLSSLTGEFLSIRSPSS
jgi:hypothetical protein